MTVRIQSAGHGFTLRLPNRLLFHKGILKWALRMGKRYSDVVPDIPPEAVDALCQELRRIQKRYGTWELADIQSASGDRVYIRL